MKERDYSVDVARGIACLLVVIGHVIKDNSDLIPKFLHSWIYSFHMPLFFIISGYVMKKNDSFFEFIKKRAKRLLYPYLALSFVVYVIDVLMQIVIGALTGKELDLHKLIANFIGIFIGFRCTDYSYIMWFVLASFSGMTLAYVVIKAVHNEFILLGIAFVFVIINYILWQYIGGLPYSVDAAFVTSAFIILGSLDLFRKLINVLFSKKYLALSLSLIASISMSLYASNIHGDVELWGCYMGNPIMFIFEALFGTIFVFMISKMLGRNKSFEKLSSWSLIFYAFQTQIVIPITNRMSSIVFRKMSFGKDIRSFEWLVTFILTMGVLVIISSFIDRYASFLLKPVSIKHK